MKYVKIIMVIILFVFGIMIGFIFKNYPIIEFNKEIKIYEVLNLLLTLTIGLSIPFFIKKWIEDSRHIKNGLVAEFKDTLDEIKNIRNKVKDCFFGKVIDKDHKQAIIVLFEETDLKISCLEDQLTQSYKKETKKIRAEIKDEYINYWKFTTSSEIMSDSFTQINENFYRTHNEFFTKIESKIKQAINDVQRL